jgi:hypothetical protein
MVVLSPAKKIYDQYVVNHCNFRKRKALGWTYIEGLVLRESLNIPGFHAMRSPVLVYHRHVCCEIIVHVELRGTALLGGGWVCHNTGDFRHFEGNFEVLLIVEVLRYLFQVYKKEIVL